MEPTFDELVVKYECAILQRQNAPEAEQIAKEALRMATAHSKARREAYAPIKQAEANPARCWDCGKQITDFSKAEREEIDPSMDECHWYCENCKEKVEPTLELETLHKYKTCQNCEHSRQTPKRRLRYCGLNNCDVPDNHMCELYKGVSLL